MIPRHLWVGVTLAVASAACGPTTEEIVQREEGEILKKAEQMVEDINVKVARLMVDVTRLQLKDPESARFRNLRVLKIGDSNDELVGGVLCGEVNARNAMGGYGGFSLFWADFVDGKADLQIMGEGSLSDKSFLELYELSCKGGHPVSIPGISE